MYVFRIDLVQAMLFNAVQLVYIAYELNCEQISSNR